MTKVMRAACGLFVGLGLALSLALPTAAQGTRELPTGAARVVEKIDLMVLTGTNQIKFHVAQILENNAGIIPGKWQLANANLAVPSPIGHCCAAKLSTWLVRRSVSQGRCASASTECSIDSQSL
jgi:hypothetical protein